MNQPEHDLELMLLGAILADPKLMQTIKGFQNPELNQVLEGLRKKEVERLKAWLIQRQVKFLGGKAIEAVRMTQNGNRIQGEIKRVGGLLKFSNPLSELFDKLTEQLKELKAEHEAHTTEKKNATEGQKQPQGKVGSQVNQASPAPKKETQTQSKPVGSPSVSGGKQ